MCYIFTVLLFIGNKLWLSELFQALPQPVPRGPEDFPRNGVDNISGLTFLCIEFSDILYKLGSI